MDRGSNSKVGGNGTNPKDSAVQDDSRVRRRVAGAEPQDFGRDQEYIVQAAFSCAEALDEVIRASKEPGGKQEMAEASQVVDLVHDLSNIFKHGCEPGSCQAICSLSELKNTNCSAAADLAKMGLDGCYSQVSISATKIGSLQPCGGFALDQNSAVEISSEANKRLIEQGVRVII